MAKDTPPSVRRRKFLAGAGLAGAAALTPPVAVRAAPAPRLPRVKPHPDLVAETAFAGQRSRDADQQRR
jgi:hypothetical protein